MIYLENKSLSIYLNIKKSQQQQWRHDEHQTRKAVQGHSI
jgi:hypothetical protein